MYLVKTPFWIKLLYPSLIWNKERSDKILYLTFDDGPNELATTFVLDELKKYSALATFFCIGKNVESHQSLYQRIIEEGHSVGNHTQHHLNGWKVNSSEYLKDVVKAKGKIESGLFRPPYGKITRFQIKLLSKLQFKIIMWDVLSGDFDINISNYKCLNNVVLNAKNGSIIVFHDSEKAFSKLEYVLPKVLKHFSEQGYSFLKIL